MAPTIRQKKAAILAFLIIHGEKQRERVERRWWVRPWKTEERRQAQGFGANLIHELRNTDQAGFRNFFRMDATLFDEILEKVTPLIKRESTNMREAISAHDRLCITLRFLATGCSYHDLMYSFRLSVPSISKIIPEVCDAMYQVLKDEYLATPQKTEDWIKLAEEFEDKWNFPHAVGAIDGKHINMRAPPNTGTEYFNYKKQFSIVLLAIADANAKFIAFELGSPGSQSDGGIFKDGNLKDICKSDIFPGPKHIGQRVKPIPYYILGDDAFGLDTNLMKPYARRTAIGDERVFNYRQSRARRIVENAFGLLCARFRVLLKTMELDVENAKKISCACIALHNFLISKKDKSYSSPGSLDSEDGKGNVVDGTWRELIDGDVCDLQSEASVRSSSKVAREIRDDLKDYFFEEGAVSFQWERS